MSSGGEGRWKKERHRLSIGVQITDKKQWTQTTMQENSFKNKKKNVFLWTLVYFFSNTGILYPDRLWRLHPWSYSDLNWTQPWATCFEQGLEQDDLQGSFPISAIHWFCDFLLYFYFYVFVSLTTDTCDPVKAGREKHSSLWFQYDSKMFFQWEIWFISFYRNDRLKKINIYICLQT